MRKDKIQLTDEDGNTITVERNKLGAFFIDARGFYANPNDLDVLGQWMRYVGEEIHDDPDDEIPF